MAVGRDQDRAISAGAFGGSRSGVLEAETNRAFAEQAARTAANLREQSRAGSMGLTFQELRARLPQEVSDSVVRLIATSEEALLDFASLETQDDIALFNQKYQSDLQLPSQVA